MYVVCSNLCAVSNMEVFFFFVLKVDTYFTVHVCEIIAIVDLGVFVQNKYKSWRKIGLCPQVTIQRKFCIL